MNNLYFGCATCRVYIDAGYRHAYWTLEHPGIVCRDEAVNSHAVLLAEKYWKPEGEDWLSELLPAVRRFLETHANHDVRFGDGEDWGLTPMYEGDYRMFDWVVDAGFAFEELPRYYIERLGFRTWAQVVEHIEQSRNPPWWWLDAEYRHTGREKFLRLVKGDGEQSGCD